MSNKRFLVLNNDFEAAAYFNSLPEEYNRIELREHILHLRSLNDISRKIKELSYFYDCIDKKYSNSDFAIDAEIMLFDTVSSLTHSIKEIFGYGTLDNKQLSLINECINYICSKPRLKVDFFNRLLMPQESFYPMFLIFKKYDIGANLKKNINQRYLKNLKHTVKSPAFDLSSARSETVKYVVEDALNQIIENHLDAKYDLIEDFRDCFVIVDLKNYDI